MTEKRGCYWCVNRENLWCSRNKFDMARAMKDYTDRTVCEESLKISIDKIDFRMVYFGSACDNFKRGTSKEKVLFT